LHALPTTKRRIREEKDKITNQLQEVGQAYTDVLGGADYSRIIEATSWAAAIKVHAGIDRLGSLVEIKVQLV
jgi:hypothetical protein